MDETVAVIVGKDDANTIRAIARCLRSGGREAQQLRDFAADLEKRNRVQGLQFQPYPGQLLVCNFGIGFQRPEIVKTRPVIVVSPQPRFNSGLCTVVPISSKPPNQIEPYHYSMDPTLIPGEKYPEAWIKGDLVQTVGLHRLDRFKVGFRNYQAPILPEAVLTEARRCVLHATGMHTLTALW